MVKDMADSLENKSMYRSIFVNAIWQEGWILFEAVSFRIILDEVGQKPISFALLHVDLIILIASEYIVDV